MVRYDLAFFLCCCKSFLGSSDEEEGFYELLGVDRDATPEEIKRAYKRQSLQMHPDKLAQRGKQVTEEDQARFTRMKEAYEVLSDPHKRETYDAIGKKGMKWVDEPFSLDPQELAHNFATSSTIDRSKIFSIFVGLAVAIFLLPVLVCLQVDGNFGVHTKWLAILFPLWIWDIFILFYHSRVIMMGPIHRPEHIPEEEWIDPLPMPKRIFSLFRFCLIILFEILVALRLDDIIGWRWAQVFFPIYIWEATTFWKKWPSARMRIVTVEDLETALGKPFAEFTQAEKDLIARRYSVVPSTSSPEFEAAHKLKSRARQDIVKLVFRMVFIIFLVVQLDTQTDWNWWIVFLPFWIMSCCVCCGNCQNFAEVQAMAAERDPEFFGMKNGTEDVGTDEENQNLNSTTNYGAMNSDAKQDGSKASSSQNNKREPITEEERDELKAQVMQSGYRMVSSCCSQSFILVIVCLLVGKLQGAGYASLWILSPLLLVAGIILCFLGCTIFCITEIPEDGMEYDSGNAGAATTAPAAPGAEGTHAAYVPPSMPQQTSTTTTKPAPTTETKTGTEAPKSTWDPERGQVWEDPTKTNTDAAGGESGANAPSKEGKLLNEISEGGETEKNIGPPGSSTIDELD